MSRFGLTFHHAVGEAVAAFLPTAGSLAVGVGADPMLLAIPHRPRGELRVRVAGGTPPNALVYGTGGLTIPPTG